MPINPGDNVLVSAVLVSRNERNNTVKLAVGWGPERSIITVPAKLVQARPTRAMEEAISWASELLGETKDEQGH